MSQSIQSNFNLGTTIEIGELSQPVNKGELIVGDGTGGPTTLTAGADGAFLQALASETSGLIWRTSPHVINDSSIGFGNTAASPYASIGWNTAQTVDGLYLGLATGQNTLIIAEEGDKAFDFAHGAQTNPTVFIHSALQSTTRYMSLAHNQTDGVIGLGAGMLSINSSIKLTGSKTITSASFETGVDTGDVFYWNVPTGETFSWTENAVSIMTLDLSGTTTLLTGGLASSEFRIGANTTSGTLNLYAGSNSFFTASGSTATMVQNWVKTTAATYIRTNDDASFDLGTTNDSSIMWETADANANMVIWSLPAGDATNVPVIAIGDVTAKTADLGFFNGVTDPTLAILSDDILSYVRFSHNGTNAVYNTNEGAHTFTQGVNTTGTPGAFTVTGGAHTGLTAATEVIGVNFNQSATKTWAAGAGPLTAQREFLFQAPVYAGDAGGALTITNATTFTISGGPTAGANMTITSSIAQSINSWDADSTNAIGLIVVPAGIEDAVGAMTSISGVQIGSNTTIGLGNTTNTLTQLTSINCGVITYDSDTNTRTVTIAAGGIFAAPSSGSNISMGNVQALRIGGAITHVSAAGFNYNAVNVLAHTLTLTGSVQVTGTPSVTAAAFGQITITDASAITVDSAATVYIANAPVAGGSVTLTKTRSLQVAAGVSEFGGAVVPASDAGSDLGTTALGWNDLHLSEGGIINFENGDVLITHSTNTLAFSGGTNYTFDDRVTMSGEIVQDGTTTSSGPGAVALTGSIHEITTTGTGDALTLADGTEGQRLAIIYVAEGAGSDTAVLTPTNMAGGTTVTFSTLGNRADGVFTAGKWYFVVQGAVIA